MTPIFVGYDIREHAAWQVCRDTLLSPILGDKRLDVEVIPLSHRDLRRRGVFDRPWRIDERGQVWDERDGRPFSTEFAHSRFLVPYLAKEMGIKSGPAMFVDCDFMFLRPVTEMLHAIDPTKVVSVVKHDFGRVQEGRKMDDQPQQRYFRKLWSSLMVFNMGHHDIDLFDTSHTVNNISGGSMHGFRSLHDDEIGDIEESWNFIPGHSHGGIIPNAVHWSFGGPWMKGFEDSAFAPEWRSRYRSIVTEAHDNNLVDLFPLT